MKRGRGVGGRGAGERSGRVKGWSDKEILGDVWEGVGASGCGVGGGRVLLSAHTGRKFTLPNINVVPDLLIFLLTLAPLAVMLADAGAPAVLAPRAPRTGTRPDRHCPRRWQSRAYRAPRRGPRRAPESPLLSMRPFVVYRGHAPVLEGPVLQLSTWKG
jgi:hypothetical protein